MIKSIQNIFLKLFGTPFSFSIKSKTLAYIRIGYALVTFFYAFAYSGVVDLIWFDTPELIQTYKVLSFVWMFFSVLVGLGFYSNAVLVLNFILTILLTTQNPIMYTVEEMFYQLLSLSFIFLPLDDAYSLKNKILKRDNKTISNSWVVYLVGLLLSIDVFIAGYNKFLDPLWRDGLGLYYTLLLPWIKTPWYNFMLDYKWLMLFLNYLALFFQLSCLPFYLFKKTRKLAIYMLVLFMLFLGGLFTGLGFIGVIGLVLVAPLLLSKERVFNADSKISNWKKIPVAIVSFLIMFQFSGVVIRILQKDYPRIYHPMTTSKVIEEKPKSTVVQKLDVVKKHYLKYPYEWCNYLSLYSFRVQDFTLFNMHHTLHIYEYKLIVEDELGNFHEPIKVFNYNKTPAKDLAPWSGLWYESQIYPISNYASELRKNGEVAEITKNRIHALLTHAKLKSNLNVKNVYLFSACLQMPDQFEGDTDLVSSQDWIIIYKYDCVENKFTSVNSPQEYRQNILIDDEEQIYLIP